MELKQVTHPDFARYGKVVEGYDFAPLLKALEEGSPKPEQGTIYQPADKDLQALPVAKQLQQNLYGGLPIQIGYCNGNNHVLNCLEYHRGSEVNLAVDDVILLLAPLQKVQDGKLDTAEVEGFILPAGSAALLYETTLHYAPCNAKGKDGFRVAIILPEATNTEKPPIEVLNQEDRMLWARNKWLLAHPAAPEAAAGAFVGLVGENITV